MTEGEVEAIARALYGAQACARGWDQEPAAIKQRLRKEARAAIEALDGHRDIATSQGIPPLVVMGNVRQVRETLLNSPEISILSVPSFRAYRVFLAGPDLRFEAATDPFLQLVGRGGFDGQPVRAALPELKGQGYFELLDQVYQTKKPFIGRMMPVLLQPRKGAPLEEHVTDFIYRPVEDAAGRIIGIFVEGYDRTEWARA